MSVETKIPIDRSKMNYRPGWQANQEEQVPNPQRLANTYYSLGRFRWSPAQKG